MHWNNPGSDRHHLGFVEPCLPTISRTVPSGSEWAFESKRVHVYSRGGHDWSKQPTITEALHSLPVRSVMLDGEGVICGPDGKSDFDRMRACFSRQGAAEAFL
jgi:bifunctional non-homologous end joining protein LigD